MTWLSFSLPTQTTFSNLIVWSDQRTSRSEMKSTLASAPRASEMKSTLVSFIWCVCYLRDWTRRYTYRSIRCWLKLISFQKHAVLTLKLISFQNEKFFDPIVLRRSRCFFASESSANISTMAKAPFTNCTLLWAARTHLAQNRDRKKWGKCRKSCWKWNKKTSCTVFHLVRLLPQRLNATLCL
jgi:hypothetical protein